MTKDRLWIGIDPGERWTGVVALANHGINRWYAEMGVIDQQQLGLYHVPIHLSDFLLSFDPRGITVVAEQYQARPQGHQAWSDLAPARLLGAVEMVALRARVRYATVKAGTYGTEVIQPVLKRWTRPSSPQWKHAISAWRVLVMYLVKDDQAVVEDLVNVKNLRAEQHRRFTFWNDRDQLTAQPISWTST